MTDAPRQFAFSRYPARQGMAWLRVAYEMFSRHRPPWVLLVIGYSLALFGLASLPFGGYVAAILKPVFEVGLLAAAWNQERGCSPHAVHRPTPSAR